MILDGLVDLWTGGAAGAVPGGGRDSMSCLYGRAAVLLTLVSCIAPAWADDTSEALAVFREYVALSDRFDPTVADLYADDAAIKTTRILPDGRTQSLALTGAQWKGLIRQAMPLAQQKGDRSTFQNVSAKPEGKGVIITAQRQSHLKQYASPYAMLLRRDENGVWKINAEVTETRP